MKTPERSPKVSIITICRNEGWKIRQTVESVLTQSFKDFELIVIDGGSTDETIDILNEYKSRFAHFVSEPDRGIYNAQNKGLAKARGEFVLFLNGGDYLVRGNVLERVFAGDTANVDILYGDLVVTRNQGRESELGRSPDPLTLDFLLSYTLWHPVSFIRRSLFEKHGNYDETYRICADYDWFLKVIGVHAARTRHVPLPIAVFNTEGIGSSPAHDKLHREERRRAQERYFGPKVLEMHAKMAKLIKEYEFLKSRVPVRVIYKLDRKFPILNRFAGSLLMTAWNLYRWVRGFPPAKPGPSLESTLE